MALQTRVIANEAGLLQALRARRRRFAVNSSWFSAAGSWRERMNERQSWVRADKLQPGDRVQDTNGNIVTIKDVNKGIWPGSILITLRDANPDFVYVESDTRIFVE